MRQAFRCHPPVYASFGITRVSVPEEVNAPISIPIASVAKVECNDRAALRPRDVLVHGDTGAETVGDHVQIAPAAPELVADHRLEEILLDNHRDPLALELAHLNVLDALLLRTVRVVALAANLPVRGARNLAPSGVMRTLEGVNAIKEEHLQIQADVHTNTHLRVSSSRKVLATRGIRAHMLTSSCTASLLEVVHLLEDSLPLPQTPSPLTLSLAALRFGTIVWNLPS